MNTLYSCPVLPDVRGSLNCTMECRPNGMTEEYTNFTTYCNLSHTFWELRVTISP